MKSRGVNLKYGRALLNSLVVVGVLGVIAALIPPAISRARESMRLSQCRRNLEQCGLALSTYHEVYRRFPPGIVAAAAPGRGYQADCDFVATTAACDWPGSSLTSGLALMLPYLGERDAHKEYNFAVACCSSANATAVARTVTAFVCPTTQGRGRGTADGYYLTSSGSPGRPATTDYVFSLGAAGVLNCENPYRVNVDVSNYHHWPGPMKSAAGVFFVNSNINVDCVKDGISNTFLMGESCGGSDLKVGLNVDDGRIVKGDQQIVEGSETLVCETPWSKGLIGGPQTPEGVSYGGYGSVFGATAWNAWYDTNRQLTSSIRWFPIRPNESGTRFGRPTWYRQNVTRFQLFGRDGSALPGRTGSIQGFRSRHAGKVHMLFADGSVRAFADSVDPIVWVELSTACGRESVVYSDPQ